MSGCLCVGRGMVQYSDKWKTRGKLMHIYICAYVNIHTHTYTYIYVYVCVFMCVCTCVCLWISK